MKTSGMTYLCWDQGINCIIVNRGSGDEMRICGKNYEFSVGREYILCNAGYGH